MLDILIDSSHSLQYVYTYDMYIFLKFNSDKNKAVSLGPSSMNNI